MKLVIPTTYCRGKKIGLCPPFCEYWVCDCDIDGETGSNRPFKVSNINFWIHDTCGQQLLTKVVEVAKNHCFHAVFRHFPTSTAIFGCRMVYTIGKMTKNGVKTVIFRDFTNLGQRVLTSHVPTPDMVLGT